jgi:ABC-type multidrug transport system fused ATPase/permease subunit
MEMLVALSLAGVLYFGGREVIYNPHMTLGNLIQFWMLVGQLVWPVTMAAYCVSVYYQTVVSGRRVFEIMDAESGLPNGTRELADPEGRVELENVSFGYEGETTLNGVSLQVEPGMTVALLGETGSGKTTLVNLLPRFYDPTEGRILIDAINVRDLSIDSLRRHVGMVLQETFLFSATLAENIGYGRPDASREEVEAAAKAAALWDFIETLPDGLDTPVGERGVTLSGGQRQRVSIARTLLMDPKVLILDDATSSVDTETEARIQAALHELERGRTTFVIAQRLSTVKRADLIVVMANGRIAQQGTHEELLAQPGLYAEIYEMQLAGQERDLVET